MRNFLFFAFFLLPAVALAQDENCLSVGRADNIVSGKVIYISFRHNDQIVTGYKLAMLKPQCYESFSAETGSLVRSHAISEVQLMPFWYTHTTGAKTDFFKTTDRSQQWQELNAYLAARIGKLVTVVGEMMTVDTAYYVAQPQLIVSSIASCEVAPKKRSVLKC